MINDLTLFLFLNGYWCIGIYAVTNEGMLLADFRDNLEIATNKILVLVFKMQLERARRLRDHIFKPICNCPICMASVHGIAGWIVFITIYSPNLIIAIAGFAIYPILLAGLNSLLLELYNGLGN